MVSKFLVKSDENERLTFPVSKDVAEEKKDLEKRAEALGFKIPYNDEVEKIIAKINKQVSRSLEEEEKSLHRESEAPREAQQEKSGQDRGESSYNVAQS